MNIDDFVKSANLKQRKVAAKEIIDGLQPVIIETIRTSIQENREAGFKIYGQMIPIKEGFQFRIEVPKIIVATDNELSLGEVDGALTKQFHEMAKKHTGSDGLVDLTNGMDEAVRLLANIEKGYIGDFKTRLPFKNDLRFKAGIDPTDAMFTLAREGFLTIVTVITPEEKEAMLYPVVWNQSIACTEKMTRQLYLAYAHTVAAMLTVDEKLLEEACSSFYFSLLKMLSCGIGTYLPFIQIVGKKEVKKA